MNHDVDYGRMLADAATRLFDSHGADPADAGVWSGSIWDAVVKAGLTRAAVSEAGGGAGLPLAEALGIVRVAVRAGVSLPIGETIIAGWLLDQAGLDVPEAPLCFVGAEGNVIRDQAPAWAHMCRVVAVDETGQVALMSNRDVMYSKAVNLADEPRDTVQCEIAVPMVAPGTPVPPARHLAALLRAVQIAEAAAVVGALTIQYAGERRQFGRPLAGFQAIQQQIAVQAGEIAAANMAANMALTALGTARFEPCAAIAKARASEAAGKIASIAHQVHGAMGFTREHRLQYFTRRLWAWRDECGSETDWSRIIGQTALTGGADALWPHATEV